VFYILEYLFANLMREKYYELNPIVYTLINIRAKVHLDPLNRLKVIYLKLNIM